MKKFLIVACLLLVGTTLFAEETFESPVVTKEIQQVYGNGTLSVATESYSIMVQNKDAFMKIEIPKKAYDILQVGDVVRITYEKGLFENEIKAIALVRKKKS